MNTREVLDKKLRDRERELEAAQKVKALIPESVFDRLDLLGEDNYVQVMECGGKVDIWLPWLPDEADAILVDLMNAGFEIESDNYRPDLATRFFSLAHPAAAHVNLMMDAAEKGSTCRLVKVGAQETPLYQVECLSV
jgi:hypothetical protein